VALPWLAVQTGGEGDAIGKVLALVALPQTLFIFVGGAVTDRISPYRVVMVANLARCLFLIVMATLIVIESANTYAVYIFSLSFGVAEAFFFPAMNALLPQVVEKTHIRRANMLMGGVAQIAMIAGPVVAGLIIQAMPGESAVQAPDRYNPAI